MGNKPTKELYPDVEFRDIRGRHAPGFLNLSQMAAVLGTTKETLGKYVRLGLIRPDFMNRAALFFDTGRLAEIKQKWADRLTSSLGSAPVVGVTTRFGMMLPRVKPDAEVLRRLMLKRPKRPSRDSSWRTRRRYNLKDLTP